MIRARSGKERYFDGNVPSVNWNGNYSELNVNRYDLGGASDFLRSREAVSLVTASIQIEAVRYLIQPLAIFDISCRSVSSSKYLLFVIIFNSLVILINLLSSSILVLALWRVGNLEIFDSKDAAVISRMISRQIFSNPRRTQEP